MSAKKVKVVESRKVRALADALEKLVAATDAWDDEALDAAMVDARAALAAWRGEPSDG